MKATQWADTGNGFMPCGDTVPKLKPGFYQPIFSGGMFPQLVVAPTQLVTDNLLELADSPVQLVNDSIQRFWKAESLYQKHGIVHKRGILMEGPPGTGKTSIANLVARFFVAEGGVVFYTSADMVAAGAEAAKHFRKVQNEPLLFIIEEFDLVMRSSGGVNMMMQLMDGVDQINNIVFLANTNHIEKIDQRFTKRPSRIDEIIHVGLPSETARKAYLSALLGSFGGTKAEVAEWVAATNGLLISHLKEAVIAVKILGRPLGETVTRLMAMVPTSVGKTSTESISAFDAAEMLSQAVYQMAEVASQGEDFRDEDYGN